MTLAGLRGLVPYSRATTWRGPGELGANLFDAEVCIVGAGGIAEQLIALLAPFRCRITVVRRRDVAMDGVERVRHRSSGSTRRWDRPTWWCWHWRSHRRPRG